jgi:hypothetical protein
MATATAPPAGLAAISRAVVSAAAELVVSVERAVVGEDNVRTARGNAWAAIQADRARAQARDEMDALVRALLTTGPRTAGAAPATTPRSTATAERTSPDREKPASALSPAR